MPPELLPLELLELVEPGAIPELLELVVPPEPAPLADPEVEPAPGFAVSPPQAPGSASVTATTVAVVHLGTIA